ncbi:MAG TPA: hypothetical protein VEY93_08665, partial [Longimicrobium sp.]|nr:hypothetical protein [Longimicrobium sp.]
RFRVPPSRGFSRRCRSPGPHPAFSALHADSEGQLWVRERDDEAGSHWAVHDADGRLAGSLTLPPRAEPLDISASHVVARWTDEDGVEFVHVYRFER